MNKEKFIYLKEKIHVFEITNCEDHQDYIKNPRREVKNVHYVFFIRNIVIFVNKYRYFYMYMYMDIYVWMKFLSMKYIIVTITFYNTGTI